MGSIIAGTLGYILLFSLLGWQFQSFYWPTSGTVTNCSDSLERYL
jgi:hypothetical protein